MSVESIKVMMDTAASFKRIEEYIKDGRIGLVRPEIDRVTDACNDDPFILIKCASLLKVIEDERGVQRILDMVMDTIPDTPKDRLSVAVALRSLGRTEDALGILDELDENDDVLREKAHIFSGMDEPEKALECVDSLSETNLNDRILLTDILCLAGRLDDAYSVASELLDSSKTYDTLVNICGVLIKMGRNKEAIKMARANIKEDKKNVDSLALGAYVMRINGKTAAAANLAHSALKIDHTHIGALETMGMCLITKDRILEAKLMAGAINDKDPGNPAAIRILDACRISRS